MFVSWRGKGIWVLAILLASGALMWLVTDGLGAKMSSAVANSIALILAAAGTAGFTFALKQQRQAAAARGQQVAEGDDFFFIPVQYWALIFLVIGIARPFFPDKQPKSPEEIAAIREKNLADRKAAQEQKQADTVADREAKLAAMNPQQKLEFIANEKNMPVSEWKYEGTELVSVVLLDVLPEVAQVPGIQSVELRAGNRPRSLDLEPLRSLPKLWHLTVGKNVWNSEVASAVAVMDSLRELVILSALVDDKTMITLAHLTDLELLEINDSRVNDTGLQALAGMKNLKLLKVANSRVTEAGVKQLREKVGAGLRVEWTGGVMEGPIEVAAVPPVPLVTTPVKPIPPERTTDPANVVPTPTTPTPAPTPTPTPRPPVVVVPPIPVAIESHADWVKPQSVLGSAERGSLQLIYSKDQKVDGKLLALVAKIDGLGRLDLTETSVADADLAPLASTSLTHLALDRCSNITDAALQHVSKIPKLTTVSLKETAVTDRGLLALQSVKGLEWVHVDDTKVTAAGAKAAEKAHGSLSVVGAPFPEIAKPDFPATPSAEFLKAETKARSLLFSVKSQALRSRDKSFPASLAALPATTKKEDKVDHWGDAYLYFGAGKKYDAFDRTKVLLLASGKAHDDKRLVAYTNGDVETISEDEFKKMKK
ncbi:MAG: hypothetical protein WD768_01725 [Phycisphaeraceae bacterium]